MTGLRFSVADGLFLAGAFLLTLAGVLVYRRVAVSHGIIAKTNFRTLHERIVPRGGGLAVALVFSSGILIYWSAGILPTYLAMMLAGGGLTAAVIGFIDDVREIRPLPKLGLQAALAVWVTVAFLEPLYNPALDGASPLVRVTVLALLTFVPLWLINLFNFIDGIDGLATIASVLAAAGAVVVLATSGGDYEFIFAFALLGAAGLGFFIFNCPPASIFMGDAGSIFFGYAISALLLATVVSGQISPYTWIALLGYFIADTSTTTILRMLMVKKWYGVHRSHAYQNLARVLKTHLPVTAGIAAYQVFWAIPLAIWSSVQPQWGMLAAVLSVFPAILWTVRFGPRFSRD